jgi:hypothetical protein
MTALEALPLTIDQFIAKWKKAELKERAAAQEHFLDLCHLLGHPTPAEADATGATFCFETFPFPKPTPAQKDAVAEAARALDVARRNWVGDRSDKKRTLTALYNERPTWLRDAHRRLDVAVFQAYGWNPSMDDEQLLDELLKLNLRRATIPTPPAP